MMLLSLVSCASALVGQLKPTALSVGFGQPNQTLTFIDATPQFSWKFAPVTTRSLKQSTYQVARSDTALVLWDSGVVKSNRTLHVQYEGPSLSSDTRYKWRVKVTTGNNPSISTSMWQSFATALLDPKDWDQLGAQWINGGNTDADDSSLGEPKAKIPAKQLRSEFSLPSAVHDSMAHASLFWVGVGYGKLWLNGEEVGAEEALGPWTTWSERILYRCKDVGHLLQAGQNALGVWLGSGQYNSHWTHAWCDSRKGCKPYPGMRLLLRVTLHNGTALTVSASSPSTWSSTSSPFVTEDVYAGVTFDARKLTDGFAEPGFKPATPWPPATLVKDATKLFGLMHPHVYTPTRVVSERFPVRMTQPSPGTYVYWFEDNDVGWAQLRAVSLPADTTLKLAHAEQLRLPNGTVCLVGCDGGHAYYAWGGAVDTYTLRGGGNESYGALFSYHGFQFVELTGWPTTPGVDPPTLTSISALVVHTDNRRIAQLNFDTGDGEKSGLLNQIHANIVRSLLGNMHSVESDCPTRERVGWTGDAQATAETAVMNLDMLGFYAKWLRDFEDAQCPGKPGCPSGPGTEGALSSTIPFAKHVPPVDPSWPTAYLQIGMLLYRYSGDESVLRARFASMRRYVDFMPTVTACPSCKSPTNSHTHAPGHGVHDEVVLPWFYMNGDWMEYEPQADELSQSGPLLSSFHYILDVSLLADVAAILGNHSLADAYKAKALKLWAAYNEVYLTQTSAPTGRRTCDASREIKKGGHPLKLACGPGGGIIDRVEFAAMGTPRGNCTAGFAHDAKCDAPGVKATVEKLCLGKESCTLQPRVGSIVAKDPCVGVIKTLAVKVHCNASVPPSPPPDPAHYAYATPGQRAGQLEQVVMLGHDMTLVPEAHRKDVSQSLLRLIDEADTHITTGFIGNKYAWKALTAIGRVDLALDLALQTTCPSYGYQVSQGATTIWENWSGTEVDSTAPMTGQGPSHNHHFMGGIGQWLQSDLVGLQQGTGIAYSHPIIAPRITNHSGLPAASGRWQTPRGWISVSWRFKRPHLALNVSTPPNTLATVVFPCHADTIAEGGVSVWLDDRFQPGTVEGVLSASVQKTGLETGLVSFQCDSGDFEFSAVCSM